MFDLDESGADLPDAEDATSTYLTLDLGGQILGMDVRHVREILDVQEITALPNAPGDVLGIADVRGQSVPILDIRARLGMVGGEAGDEARVVVLELGAEGETYPLGILADRVRNVEAVWPAAIEPVPRRGLGHWNADALLGIYRRGPDLVVLVDLERLLGEVTGELDLSEGFGLF